MIPPNRRCTRQLCRILMVWPSIGSDAICIGVTRKRTLSKCRSWMESTAKFSCTTDCKSLGPSPWIQARASCTGPTGVTSHISAKRAWTAAIRASLLMHLWVCHHTVTDCRVFLPVFHMVNSGHPLRSSCLQCGDTGRL
jgi:hypothetical protein